MRSLRTNCLLLSIALAPLLARGQSLSAPDSTEAAAHLARSLSFLKKGGADSSFFFEKKALAVFQKSDALAGWHHAMTDRASFIAGEMGRPLEAVEFIRDNEKTGWRDPRTVAEWKAKLRFNNFAAYFAEVHLGDFQLVRAVLERSYEDFNAHLGPAEKGTAYYIFGQLGNVCTRLGDYERAQMLLKQKADLALQNRDLPTAADALHNLAIALNETGQLDSAIACERRALALPDNPEFPFHATYLTGLAGYLLQKKEVAAASAACRQARAVHKNWTQKQRECGSFSLSEITNVEAEIAVAVGQIDRARQNYRASLATLAAEFGGTGRRETAKLRIKLGDLDLEQGRTEAALAYFQAALRDVVPGFSEKDPAQNPRPEQFYPENTIREALDGKARAFVAEGKRQKAKGKKAEAEAALRQALACHELLEEVEQRLRGTYQFESSSLQALDEGRARLERAVDIAHALFVETGDPAFARHAFLFCEKSKGLLLLQGIARARADFKLPEPLRRREEAVRGRLAFLEKQILEKKATGGQPGDEIKKLEGDLLKAKHEQQRLWEDLKKEAPEYVQISQVPEWSEATDLAAMLEPGQAMVEYLLGEGHVFVFRATADGQFSMRKAALPPDFLMKIDWLRGFFEKYDPSAERQRQFIETSAGLFKLLLGEEMADPLFSKNSRLLVVPDGVLAFVPFEALLEKLPDGFLEKSAADGPFSWAALDFLLKKKVVSYAWSASLLRTQLKKEVVDGLENFAAFTPDYSGKSTCDDGPDGDGAASASRESGAGLPGAKAEADAIEQLIGGRFFREGAATRDNFLASAGRFRIVHLAMHAVSDAEEPARSRLIFSCEEDRPLGSNRLYVNDLQQIALHAELAVLSACNTGNGRLHRGEGVYSLARGFALAGVPATLMSLWRLSDDSAPELMSVFYKNLKAGARKDDALHAAKLGYLTGPGAPPFKHPYFWAGMVANGNMRPVDTSGGGGSKFGWMVLLASAAAFMWWFSAKHRFFSKTKN